MNFIRQAPEGGFSITHFCPQSYLGKKMTPLWGVKPKSCNLRRISGWQIHTSPCVQLLKHHCRIFQFWHILVSLIVCLTYRLVLGPLQTGMCLSSCRRLLASPASALEAQPSLEWLWEETAEADRWGKLAADWCAPVQPVWCPSLQGFRPRRGRREVKSTRGECMKCQPADICVTQPNRVCPSPPRTRRPARCPAVHPLSFSLGCRL